jgi:hypothetical protein
LRRAWRRTIESVIIIIAGWAFARYLRLAPGNGLFVISALDWSQGQSVRLYQKGLKMGAIKNLCIAREECYEFTSPQEAHDFGYENGIPFSRLRDMSEMNSCELLGLRIRREWVLGIRTLYCFDVEGNRWHPVKREYASLDRFRIENNELLKKRKVVILGYYGYQLSHDPKEVIHLESLSSIPLSSQLSTYTGDGFADVHFYSEDDMNSLRPGNVIVHKKTHQRFFIPAAPLDRFE